MMSRFKLLPIGVCLGMFATFAASAHASWPNFFDADLNRSEVPNTMTVDSTGNVYVACTTISSTDANIVLLKYSKLGTLLWTESYGSAAEDENPIRVIVDGQDNVIVLGSASVGADRDGLVIKYSKTGTRLWATTFSGYAGKIDNPTNIAAVESDTLLITDQAYNPTNGASAYLIKLTANGAKMWGHLYGTGTSNNYFTSVEVMSTGDYVVCGNLFGSSQTGNDIGLLRFKPDGTQVWKKTWAGKQNSYDQLGGVTLDQNDDIILGGTTQDDGSTDMILLRYNKLGKKLWQTRFGNPNTREECYGVELDAAGNIYTAGPLRTSYQRDIILGKFSSTGEKVWSKSYVGDGIIDYSNDELYNMWVDDAGNLTLIGRSQDSETMKYRNFVTEYSTTGVRKYNKVTILGGDEVDENFLYSTAIDRKLGATYVGGHYINPDTGSQDIYLARY